MVNARGGRKLVTFDLEVNEITVTSEVNTGMLLKAFEDSRN